MLPSPDRPLPRYADLITSSVQRPPSPPRWVDRLGGTPRKKRPVQRPVISRDAAGWARAVISEAVDEGEGTVDLTVAFSRLEWRLTELPPEIRELRHLTLLENPFTSREDGPCKPHGLRLLLSGNAIRSLHPDLFALDQLTVLTLNGNHLQCIPREIAKLSRLEILSIGGNDLTCLPGEILSLPRLKTLSLLPNPFEVPPPETIPCPHPRGLPCHVRGHIGGSLLLSLHELALRSLIDHPAFLHPCIPPHSASKLADTTWISCPLCSRRYAESDVTATVWLPHLHPTAKTPHLYPFILRPCSMACLTIPTLFACLPVWDAHLCRLGII